MSARGDRLAVQVLGPLRVRDAEGRDVAPEGDLQRRLLALLVLRRGRVVTAGSAIEALWPRKPPRDPAAALHNHVSRLRGALPGGVIDSVRDGYRLEPGRIDVDADRLVELVHAAETDTDPAAPASLDDLLQGWRGPAYPELDEVDDGRAEAARLGELRVRAVEVRAAWRLSAGATGELLAELAALADAEPRRERPRSLLMEALAAAGRQVEALRVYDDFRRLLGDELGIEPSPVLAAQHAELLAGSGAGGGAAWAPPGRLPVPAATLIGRGHLVAHCPNVTVVATSRERLRVQGERVCAVPTLDATAEDSPAN